MNDRYSKLAFLHRVKERKTPSLSAQASFAPFSLKVAWSGKSLIDNQVKRKGKTSLVLWHEIKTRTVNISQRVNHSYIKKVCLYFVNKASIVI